MHTEDPLEVLADIESLRNRTSVALNADGWQWMMVWSIVAFGAGLTVLVDPLDGIAGLYWFGAVPLALLATALLERRSKEQRAVRRDSKPYWSVGATMGIVNFGASMVLEPETIVIVIWVVIGLGFAAFALIDGDRPTTAVYVAASALAVLLGVVSSDAFSAYATISMLFAGLLAGSAVQVFSRYRTA
jgi:hypothetical protein